jgi:hypothetical protein
VVARNTRALGAWAFVLDQSQFPFESLQEGFDPERFAQRQVSLKSLEKRLDVRFDALLHEADTLAGHDGAGVEITSHESIQALR